MDKLSTAQTLTAGNFIINVFGYFGWLLVCDVYIQQRELINLIIYFTHSNVLGCGCKYMVSLMLIQADSICFEIIYSAYGFNC